MKYLLTIFFLISTVPLFAQSDQDTAAMSDPYFVLDQLKETWSAGIGNDGFSQKNDHATQDFIELFDTTRIVGDIDASFYYHSRTYKAVAFEELVSYGNKMGQYFRSISFTFSDTLSMDSSNGIITYTVARAVSGYKEKQFTKVFVTDSEIMNIELLGDPFYFILNDTIDVVMSKGVSDYYKIIGINRSVKKPNYKLVCMNDIDSDGITDDVDSCVSEAGLIEYNGCPEPVISMYPPKMEFGSYIGLQFNSSKINLPELDQLGYEEVDVLQSNKGNITSPKTKAGFMTGADITYFFGDSTSKRSSGITLGASYSWTRANYSYSEPVIYTYKSNDGIDDYRRRITIKPGSTEELTTNVINIPVLYTHRWIIEKKETKIKGGGDYDWSFKLSAGPSLLMFKNASDYNVNIDFEGLYQIDPNLLEITYTDYFDVNSPYSVFVTIDSINAATGGSATAVFDSLNSVGYDFAINKNYQGKSRKLSRTTVAINLNFDACYQIKPDLSILVGASATYARLSGKEDNYIPIDKTSDSYNSIYNSKTKTDFFSFCLKAGIIISFNR